MKVSTKIFFVISLSTFSTGVFAEEPEPKPATKPIPAIFDWTACKANIDQFCKGVDGNENIFLCLAKHEDDLSKACDVPHTAYEVVTGRQ